MNIVFIMVSVVAALYLLIKIIKSIARKEYGVDILAFLAIGSTLLAGEYLASILIVVMLVTGELLERYAGRRARRELTRLISKKPKFVHLADGSGDIPATKAGVGTELLVKTGEMILLDAVLLSGSATLDTANITGESLPREVQSGGKVISGTLNVGSPIQIRTTTDLEHSQFSQLEAVVKDIENKPARFVRLADRYAVPFTLVSLIIAGTAWAISGEFVRFAEVLVLASPCPLILAAPIAFVSGMSRAFGSGILVKNGTNLERLSNIGSVAFDKTGTLSSGKLTVSGIKSFSRQYSEGEILKMAATMEQGSTHPLAIAIIEHYKDQVGQVPAHGKYKISEHTGMGIDAKLGKKKLTLGSLTHMKQHHIPIGGRASSSAIYLALNRKLIGQIDFFDRLKARSSIVISDLKKLGLDNVALVTGDNRTVAEKVARELGIKTIFADQLPTGKVEVVKNLQPKPALFVGDGLNDAPVLAAADVGIAMGAFGSPLAMDSAGVVIMSDDIAKVPLAIRIAQATRSTATRSVLIGIAVCTILMLVAAFGLIPAVIGALLQEAIDALSVASALVGKKIK